MTRFIPPINRIFARSPPRVDPIDKLVPASQIPLPDQEELDRRFFSFSKFINTFTDTFITDGPYSPIVNITLLAAEWSNTADFKQDYGVRLYYTPTQPGSVNSLKDQFQVWPQRRTRADVLAEGLPWDLNQLSFNPVSDRKRNFKGWISIRFRNNTGKSGTFLGYVQLNENQTE